MQTGWSSLDVNESLKKSLLVMSRGFLQLPNRSDRYCGLIISLFQYCLPLQFYWRHGVCRCNPMSLAKINNKTFTAHLYLDGRPMVLNQQRLQQALYDPRITNGEKLDAEVALADSRKPSIITLADHEDDTPLVLKFVPKGNEYIINLELPGTFEGAQLFIEDTTENLLASTSAPVQYFSFRTASVLKASLSDIDPGPAYVELISKPSNRPLYRHVSRGVNAFVSAQPNATGHNAFNQLPATFVIKLIKQPPVAA